MSVVSDVVALCGPPVLSATEQQRRLMSLHRQHRQQQRRLVAIPSAESTLLPVVTVLQQDSEVGRMEQMQRDARPMADWAVRQIEWEEQQRALLPRVPGVVMVEQWITGALPQTWRDQMTALALSFVPSASASSASSSASQAHLSPSSSSSLSVASGSSSLQSGGGAAEAVYGTSLSGVVDSKRSLSTSTSKQLGGTALGGGGLFAPEVNSGPEDTPIDYGLPSVDLSGRPPSAIAALTVEMASQLRDRLPARQRLLPAWELVFSSAAHGYSMHTLMERTREYDAPTMIVVRDLGGAVFGGFASRPWQFDAQYHGTGESFLWRRHGTSNNVQVYQWSRRNDYFMLALNAKRAESSYIAMGGGNDGRYGIWLHESLTKGHSSTSLTFRNDILSSTSDFEVSVVEVWGLDVSGRPTHVFGHSRISFHN